MIDRFAGEYRFLSNFYPAPVEFEGLMYPTVEHAYQAAKTLDGQARAYVAGLATPGQAKRAGRGLELRSDWEQVKLAVMETLLRKKFSFPHLRGALLSTKPEPLIEGNTWGDRFWGQCAGVGENNLGKLLMKIRDETAARAGEL